MFEISVEREFCAAHALVIAGVREITHGHNFHITITVASPTLDADGLLVDFHALERLLDDILRPFHNADLNATPPFDRLNPSAERIAEHIGQLIHEGLAGITPPEAPRPLLTSVRLTEAPGCSVTYSRPARADGLG